MTQPALLYDTDSTGQLDTLRSLIAAQKWVGLLTLIAGVKKGAHLADMCLLLDHAGDDFASAQAWGHACHCFHFAQWPLKYGSKIRIPGSRQRELDETLAKLPAKFSQALLKAGKEEPGFWKSLAGETIALASVGLFDHAEERLKWFYNGHSRYSYASQFEKAAGQMEPAGHPAADWLRAKAAERSDPERENRTPTFTRLIRCMEVWLAENRPSYFAALQPGVTAQQLDQFEARFGLRLPSDFRELYQWRNGQPVRFFESLQGNRMFAALETIANEKAGLDEMIDTEFDDPKWWRRGWVPFLDNGAGDYLCLDLTAEDGGTPGQLRAYWHTDDDRPVEYRSLEAWLRELVKSMEADTIEIL